ncbi:MAG: hypothetical protein QOG20_2503 [Pseudonocardiales bacterium]|jgi:hypothetical protein|nr:hypothetical protein [Pseudonocardiales bacterium]
MGLADDARQKLLDVATMQAAAWVGSLPPPFGPAAVDVAGLLGFVVGGSNLTTADAQTLINNAVSAVEKFITGLGVSDAKLNATGVMTRIAERMAFYDTHPAEFANHGSHRGPVLVHHSQRRPEKHRDRATTTPHHPVRGRRSRHPQPIAAGGDRGASTGAVGRPDRLLVSVQVFGSSCWRRSPPRPAPSSTDSSPSPRRGTKPALRAEPGTAGRTRATRRGWVS